MSIRVVACDDSTRFDVDPAIFAMWTKVAQPLGDEDEIQLADTSGKMLGIVIAWCRQHACDPPRSQSAAINNVPEWDRSLLGTDPEQVIPLTKLASDLGIQYLLELCCNIISSMIKGCTPQELQEKFKIGVFHTD